MNEEQSLGRLETTLGRLLQAGVLTAAAALAVGLALWLAGGDAGVANPILAAGLMILIATPILRVMVSLIAYAKMRDWFFVTTTLIVFAVLLTSVFLALHGRR